MNRIMRKATEVWKRYRAEQAVGQLTAAAAADIGVTPGDLIGAARMRGDVPERMQRMAAVFGAEAALDRTGRFQVLDMAQKCNCCAARDTCGTALDDPRGIRADQVDFCPNSDDYRAMASSR